MSAPDLSAKIEMARRVLEIRDAANDLWSALRLGQSPDPEWTLARYIEECLNDIDGVSAQIREQLEEGS
jgi:hypothetical protein